MRVDFSLEGQPIAAPIKWRSDTAIARTWVRGAEVIFVSLWGSKEDDEGELAHHHLGGQPNLEIRRHPNQTRRGTERVTSLLGNRVTWIPTTWVYREGILRYALNYGEVRFEMLQQLVNDSRPGQW